MGLHLSTCVVTCGCPCPLGTARELLMRAVGTCGSIFVCRFVLHCKRLYDTHYTSSIGARAQGSLG